MDNKQTAKLAMYSSIINLCYNHTDIIASIPALQTAFDSFKGTVLTMGGITFNEGETSAGITLDKKQLQENLARVTAFVALKAYAYADAVGNNELKGRVNFTMPELMKLKDKALPGVCLSIVAHVNANLPALAAHNITAASVKEITDALEIYEAYMSRPRNAAAEASVSVVRLNAAIKKSDGILKNQMDKIVTTLSVTYEEFYQLWFQNRIIIDPHTTPTQIKGTVTAKDSEEPLRGVTIKIVGSKTSVTTNGDGKYVMKQITPNTYSVEATKKGYETVTINNIKVKLGQIAKMDIVMEEVG